MCTIRNREKCNSAFLLGSLHLPFEAHSIHVLIAKEIDILDPHFLSLVNINEQGFGVGKLGIILFHDPDIYILVTFIAVIFCTHLHDIAAHIFRDDGLLYQAHFPLQVFDIGFAYADNFEVAKAWPFLYIDLYVHIITHDAGDIDLYIGEKLLPPEGSNGFGKNFVVGIGEFIAYLYARNG